MDRDDILDRILYGYFLEQLFSVATGRLDKLLSVVSVILGSSVIGGFVPGNFWRFYCCDRNRPNDLWIRTKVR